MTTSRPQIPKGRSVEQAIPLNFTDITCEEKLKLINAFSQSSVLIKNNLFLKDNIFQYTIVRG